MPLDPRQKIAVALALLPVLVVWNANGIYMSPLAQRSAVLFWIADFAQWVALPVATMLLLIRTVSIWPSHYGFRTMPVARGLLLILITPGIAATIGIAFFWSRDAAWALMNEPTGFFGLSQLFPSGVPGRLLYVYSAITAGVVESAFFIGLPWLLYSAWRPLASRVLFAFIVSVVFAIAHWEQGPHVVIGAFVSHIVMCWWYFASGSLWPIAVSHILVDLVAFSD